mmetsp:Transcript_29547/g.91890  ORF Transcript_29547/g.91890 Transcript_29547/m.91890 type:complete len:112 (-) Transcript_29547:33-368(-)
MVGTTMQVSDALSSLISSSAVASFGVTSRNFRHLSALIVFCSCFAVLPFPFVLFFPAPGEEARPPSGAPEAAPKAEELPEAGGLGSAPPDGGEREELPRGDGAVWPEAGCS